MAAASIFTLMGGIGLSVDYLGMTERSAELQAAVDAAALAAVLSGEDNEASVRLASDDYFNALRDRGISVTSEYLIDENSITVKARTSYQPRIMGIFGFGRQNIGKCK